ncbi:MAG: hypothetical protein ACE37K_10740 [Planctomycetota bacterium]
MTIPTPRRTALPVALLSALLLTGCHRGPIEVIDLDQVLDILSEELKRPIDGATPETVEIDKAEDGKVAGLDETAVKPEMTQQFLTRFAKALNAAQLMTTPIGVRMDGSGSLYGFTDHDRNMQQNGSDRALFRIDIDPDNGRMIATDLQRPQYRRDHHYRGYYHGYGYHGGGGFWMGYMLGSMRGRSDRYYAEPSRRRPSYSTMSMAPRGYHAAAQQQARTRARSRSRSSARSRGGSSSFRSGK